MRHSRRWKRRELEGGLRRQKWAKRLMLALSAETAGARYDESLRRLRAKSRV